MKVRYFIPYFLFTSALCKGHPTLNPEPTEDRSVHVESATVVPTPLDLLPPLVSGLDPTSVPANPEPHLDSDEIVTAAGVIPPQSMQSTPLTVAEQEEMQFVANFRGYRSNEVLLEHVFQSLCEQYPETDQAFWRDVVDRADDIIYVTFYYHYDVERVLEKSMVQLKGRPEAPDWFSDKEFRQKKIKDLVKVARIHQKQRNEGQAYDDNMYMDKAVAPLLVSGDAKNWSAFMAGAFRDAMDDRIFEEYIDSRSENLHEAQINNSKFRLERARGPLFHAILQKLEILHKARMEFRKEKREMERRNEALPDVDSWTVSHLASQGMDGMDLEKLKMVFKQARAMVDLTLALCFDKTSAVRLLIMDKSLSIPESLLYNMIKKEEMKEDWNMDIISALYQHSSFTEKTFEDIMTTTLGRLDTYEERLKSTTGSRDRDPEDLKRITEPTLRLLLRNQHKERFSAALQKYYEDAIRYNCRSLSMIFKDEGFASLTEIEETETEETETEETETEETETEETETEEKPKRRVWVWRIFKKMLNMLWKRN